MKGISHPNGGLGGETNQNRSPYGGFESKNEQEFILNNEIIRNFTFEKYRNEKYRNA